MKILKFCFKNQKKIRKYPQGFCPLGEYKNCQLAISGIFPVDLLGLQALLTAKHQGKVLP